MTKTFLFHIGITVLNQSLSITHAQKELHEGKYRCVAFNSESKGTSNEVYILVDCK